MGAEPHPRGAADAAENRRVATLTARVPRALKARVATLGAFHGSTESEMVRHLLERALPLLENERRVVELLRARGERGGAGSSPLPPPDPDHDTSA